MQCYQLLEIGPSRNLFRDKVQFSTMNDFPPPESFYLNFHESAGRVLPRPCLEPIAIKFQPSTLRRLQRPADDAVMPWQHCLMSDVRLRVGNGIHPTAGVSKFASHSVCDTADCTERRVLIPILPVQVINHDRSSGFHAARQGTGSAANG